MRRDVIFWPSVPYGDIGKQREAGDILWLRLTSNGANKRDGGGGVTARRGDVGVYFGYVRRMYVVRAVVIH